MTRLALLLVLAAMMFGAAGLATTTEKASAGPLPDVVGPRLDLDCTQVIAPGEIEEYPNVGVVHCTVTVDIPEYLEIMFGWPDTVEYDVWGAYGDRDGNARPSHGDRLLCIKVVGPGPNGPIDIERCRPGIEVPDEFPLPDGS